MRNGVILLQLFIIMLDDIILLHFHNDAEGCQTSITVHKYVGWCHSTFFIKLLNCHSAVTTHNNEQCYSAPFIIWMLDYVIFL